MPTIDDIRGVPCPTCRVTADSRCVEVDSNGEMAGPRVDGVHNTRIHRYQVVTEAIAHNRAVEAQKQEPMTSEIAIPTNQPGAELAVFQEANIARLGRWAQQADSAVRIAEVVCNSTMAPSAYRGKPNEAAAAILAGAELGFDPMASLRAFDNIQGTPAPKAMTLRAVAQRAGHEIVIVESSADRCVVKGRRKGDTEWQTSTWDVARAEQMPQYKSNPNWRTSPAAMLVARATSEVCRWIASDAIMGMPYSAEEIADTTGLTPAAPTRGVTAADIVGMAIADRAAPPADPVFAMDFDEAIARIKTADTQAELDDIRQACQDAGLRDQAIKDAWAARSAELAGSAA